jgi:hypothetical protein
MRSPIGDGLTLLVVEKKDPLAWAMMPALKARIEKFCATYDSDAKPDLFLQQLEQSFILVHPGIIGMLLLDDKAAIVGHIVLTLEDWMGTKMATILQLECDVPLTEELFRVPLEWFEWWAKASGAQFFQCFARNEAAARLFEKKFGFEKKRVLMRKRLEAE